MTGPSENPLAELSDYELRHLVAHLESSARIAALHHLLALETGDGRNAWYVAREQIGDITGYADDITRAWRLAEAATAEALQQGEASETVVLEVAYALLTSTLNTQASNIPAYLFKDLLADGIWPPRIALEQIRRISKDHDRKDALVALSSQIGDCLPRAFALAAALPSRYSRAETMTALAVSAPPEEKEQYVSKALEASIATEHWESLKQALTDLVDDLPQATLEQTLRSALGKDEVDEWIEGLECLGSHLSDEFVCEIVDSLAPSIHVLRKARLLRVAAPKLSPVKKEELLTGIFGRLETEEPETIVAVLQTLASLLDPPDLCRATRIAERISHLPDRFLVWEAFLPFLGDEERTGVLTRIPAEIRAVATEVSVRRGFPGEKGLDPETLATVASHLPEPDRCAALADALAPIRQEGSLGLLFESVAPWLPHVPPEACAMVVSRTLSSLLDQALEAEANAGGWFGERGGFEDAKAWTSFFDALGQHLPDEVLRKAVSLARVLPRPFGAVALASVARFASPDELEMLLDEAANGAVSDRDEIETNHDSLVLLLPYLDQPRLERVLAKVSLFDGFSQSAILTMMEPRLSGPMLEAVLRAARLVPSPAYRAQTLAGFARRTDGERRKSLLRESLRASRAVLDETEQITALLKLAPYLPEVLLRELLAKVPRLWEMNRPVALATLGPHLPPEFLEEAIGIARAIKDDRYRAQALTDLLRFLPAAQKNAVRAEVLSTVRAFRNPTDRAGGLARLLGHTREQIPLLRELFSLAGSLQYPNSMAFLLAGVTPRLREDAMALAEELAKAIRDTNLRLWILAGLAPHFAAISRFDFLSRLLQAVGRAKGIERAELIALFAPHLPPDLALKAVQLVYEVKEPRRRAYALVQLAQYLSADEIRDLIASTPNLWPLGQRGEPFELVAPSLPDELLEPVFDMAMTLSEDKDRSRALTALAPRLPGRKRLLALREAVAAVIQATTQETYPGQSPPYPYELARHLAELSTEEMHAMLRETLQMQALASRSFHLSTYWLFVPMVGVLGGIPALTDVARATNRIVAWFDS